MKTIISSQQDFIVSPISNILRDALSASAGIGDGIETYPLCQYILQTTFLKMTGFQEQKMKCICWELATNDYEYRYMRFSKKPIGECSNFDDKNAVYKDLISQIKKFAPSWKLSEIKRDDLLSEAKKDMEDLFENTNWVTWNQNDYNKYKDFVREVEEECILDETAILLGCKQKSKRIDLKEAYEKLYRQRNRCAHNTLSYQNDLPTLSTLARDDYKYENYFVRFFLLMLIDNIIVRLYMEYVRVLDDNVL